MPKIPVLPETLLRLDLEMYEPCVDLGVISDAVLRDLGATLQILHLAGCEYGHCSTRPTRIEDCIADLGLRACIGAVSSQSVLHPRQHKAIGAIWSHSREIAHCAKHMSEEMPTVHPHEAYLVGLLHGLGWLPGALGWSGEQAREMNPALAGLRLATGWALPVFILEFFAEWHKGGYATHWPEIMGYAHRRASRCAIDCSFQPDVKPMLLRVL